MTTRHKNIRRIDCERANGWQVVIVRNKRQHTRFFSRRAHGTLKVALAKAIEHRDKMLVELPSIVRVKIAPNCGVRFDGRNWVAQWVGGDGKRRTRKFSVMTYGRRNAKAIARAARDCGVHGIAVPSGR